MPVEGHVYRVDKFVVPQTAREEFLGRVKATHEVLRRQPGFVRDAVLEQTSGPGRFNIVTIAEWENNEAIEGARSAVMAAHAAEGFNAQETILRLGIEADLAFYETVAS